MMANINRRAKRLVALLVAAALLIAASGLNSSNANPNEPETLSPGGGQQQGIGDRIDPKDVWVDAFDMQTCGDANFRPWQEAQSAFGCADNSYDYSTGTGSSEPVDGAASGGVGPRIFRGRDALEGEFPLYVHILDAKNKQFFICGATLIDKNLVVTAAHCLVDKMTLVLGSNWFNGTGGQVRQASRWCQTRIFKYSNFSHDLAVIRFDDPVEYVPKKIWPACIRLDSRHKDETVCAFAGLGSTGPVWGDHVDPVYLQTSTVKRTRTCDLYNDVIYNSCYLPFAGAMQLTRPGDSGSPLFCYDRNGTSNRTQAYAVGALATVTWHPPGQNGITDFSVLQQHFLDLLDMIHQEGESISNNTICEVPLSYSSTTTMVDNIA